MLKTLCFGGFGEVVPLKALRGETNFVLYVNRVSSCKAFAPKEKLSAHFKLIVYLVVNHL